MDKRSCEVTRYTRKNQSGISNVSSRLQINPLPEFKVRSGEDRVHTGMWDSASGYHSLGEEVKSQQEKRPSSLEGCV